VTADGTWSRRGSDPGLSPSLLSKIERGERTRYNVAYL
jgi:hypothetical protein